MPVFYGIMLLVYAATLFVSASLLFLIQPMVGKMILPYLGGAPAVWNTCMVFFQAMLLLGYTYAHLTTVWLGVRLQAIVHLLVLVVPVFVLPIMVNIERTPQGEANPVFGVLALLFVTAGLPFFMVASSAPLLQKWFASTGHPAARDPYFLYGASNLGSMLALFSYPLLVEPYKALPGQSWLWAFGYFLLAMLTAACAAFLGLSPKKSVTSNPWPAPAAQEPGEMDHGPRTTDGGLSAGRRLRWIALAFVPSSLMLAVTTFVTTDIAAVPFLWILPLGIYLISFILVFSRIPPVIHWIMVGLLPLMVLVLVFMMVSAVKPIIWWEIVLHLITLFVVSMVCHGELARDRPPTAYLTGFYLLMSLGGVLGGIFNTLAAPLIFASAKEYDLALVLACLLIPRLGPRERTTLSLLCDLVLAWVIGTLGAYLVTMALRYNQVHPEALVAPVATRGTLFCLVALLLLIAGYFFLGKRDTLNRLFDLVLPLLLAFFLFGLLWGLPALRERHPGFDAWMDEDLKIGEVVVIPALQVPIYLMFGLPCLFCLAFFRRPMQFGLGVAALLLLGGLYDAQDLRNRKVVLLHQERSYYGVLTVEGSADEAPGIGSAGRRGKYHWLTHGNISHGVQRIYQWQQLGTEIFAPLAACRPADVALAAFVRNQIWTSKHYPVAYFHPKSPYGQMFLSFKGKYAKKNVAIIGLGTGGLSGYAYPGQKWTYFELDPAVEKIARNKSYFTYLSDCQDRGVDLKVILGDARVQLRKINFDKPEDKFDVIAFDAFTSDAIPIHLVTYNALEDYLGKLTDNGIVVFHISNRYVDLVPVIARLQQEAGLAGLIQNDPGDYEDPEHYATWVIILARRMEAFGSLARDSRWRKLQGWKGFPLWTDDYSNLLGVFKWRDDE